MENIDEKIDIVLRQRLLMGYDPKLNLNENVLTTKNLVNEQQLLSEFIVPVLIGAAYVGGFTMTGWGIWNFVDGSGRYVVRNKIEDFFNAPYYVYSDNKPYNLKFYSTYNGVKVYNIYEKKLLTLNPDNEQVLKRTKEGVRFIMQFCKDTKISYKDYFTHYTDKINTFWMHLKENRINVYCLFLCDNLYNIYNRSDKDVINFMLDNLMKNINMYRTVYYNSIITKRVLSEIKHHFSH